MFPEKIPDGATSLLSTIKSDGVGLILRGLPNLPIGDLVEGISKWRRQPAPRENFPNREKLSSVREFFQYAETEARKLFEELDEKRTGQVSLSELELAMQRRKLPKRYAREFLRRTRKHWLAKTIGWEEFSSAMEQKEASMLKAFISLQVTSSGTLHKKAIMDSMEKAGLPATEENAKAMMRFLNADVDSGHITYGQFRNFMFLLPPEQLKADPSTIWYEAATMVPMTPPPNAPSGSVLKSALAGGIASGLSTCIMHPLDTIKTRVQASSESLGDVISSVPKLGVVGLYRGAIPAIVGQFASHGIRTGAFEATKLMLRQIQPDMSDLQVQPIASFCSTVLGTSLRIPCEVMKQRLQAGMFPDLSTAFSATLKNEGVGGFFRGTTATLFREVPFYVFGMLIYQEVKKATKHALRRELAPWETLLVGGISGGLAAVAITPFDVIKTRMMTASLGSSAGLFSVGMQVASSEGVGALYKGALPRFFWIAPLGAMNFAGYELAKQAMEKDPEPSLR